MHTGMQGYGRKKCHLRQLQLELSWMMVGISMILDSWPIPMHYTWDQLNESKTQQRKEAMSSWTPTVKKRWHPWFSYAYIDYTTICIIYTYFNDMFQTFNMFPWFDRFHESKRSKTWPQMFARNRVPEDLRGCAWSVQMRLNSRYCWVIWDVGYRKPLDVYRIWRHVTTISD